MEENERKQVRRFCFVFLLLLLLLLFIFCLFANCFSPGWVVTEAMTAFLGRESCKHKQHICNTVWLKNGQHVSVQNNKGGKPQTNTNSNRILWKKVKLSHYLAEVFALSVCLFLLFSIRFILE